MLDESALLACAAYIDLNPIRAAMAETLESSDYTSVQRRIQALELSSMEKDASASSTTASSPPATSPVEIANGNSTPLGENSPRASSIPILNPTLDARQPAVPVPVPDCFLSPLWLDERNGELGAVPNVAGFRCSDKGFLPLPLGDYLTLLDWTGRQLANGKRGRIPNTVAPILARLKLDRKTWCELVGTFGRRFFHVAGQPTTIDSTASCVSQQRYYVPSRTRELFQDASSSTRSSA